MEVRTGFAALGATSGDLKLYYEDMGDIDDPPVLLIMGLGAQLLLWRTGFCEKLVGQGLRVIRYDNRDVGLSSKTEHRSSGQPLATRLVRSWLGLRSAAAYTLEDMADDAAEGYDRNYYPQGVARHFSAVLGSGSLARYNRRIVAPTVVIHGRADKLMRPFGGRKVARAIDGARLVLFDGMGHDLPQQLWDRVIGVLTSNFANAR